MIEDSPHTGKNQFLGTDQELLSLFDGFRLPESENGKEKNWSQVVSQIEQLKRASRRLNQRFMLLAAASFTLIVSVSIFLQWQFALVQVDVPAGRITQILLPDSSRVTINAGSTIKFKRYSFHKRRSVSLRGEAYFDVTKGNGQFTVLAGPNTIGVLGTRFNVMYRNGHFLAECLEGEVTVYRKDDKFSKKISSGAGVRMEPSKKGFTDIAVNETTAAAWRWGEFYFDGTHLNQVFEEMERQYGVTISAKGFAATGRKYTGYFSSGNMMEALELVCGPMGLKYNISKDSTRIEVLP